VSKRDMNQDDRLEAFESREITLEGVTKKVHVARSGPAVIVMTEMPGISPQVARFSRWVRDAGFTVYMPSLFGSDGAVPGVEEGTAIFRRGCVPRVAPSATTTFCSDSSRPGRSTCGRSAHPRSLCCARSQ